MDVTVVTASTYGFRGVYAPMLRDLSRVARIRLLLLDFPEDYDARPLLKELQQSGVVQEATLIPDNRRAWSHHAAMRRHLRALRLAPMDALVTDGDFLPMHQYLIRAARSKGALVVALQVSPPAKLMASYRARGRAGAVPRAVAQANGRRIGKAVARLWGGPHRAEVLRQAASHVRGRCVYRWHLLAHYRLLPLLMTGRPLACGAYEREATVHFASTRVHAALVYSEAMRDAVRHFFPTVPVHVAEHPLSTNCRCNGQAPSSMLLVTLKGPWRKYVAAGGSAEAVVERWCRTILQAVELQRFSAVHIRPHPREDGPEPQALAQRLVQQGVAAQVLEPRTAALSEVICDYAGVLGAPSGALAEAASACRRAFVIGVEGVQEGGVVPPAEDYAAEVVCVSADRGLRREDFERRRLAQDGGMSVREILQQLMAGRCRS